MAASFGSWALCVTIVLFAIFPLTHSQSDFPLNSDELTGPIQNAITHSLDEYNVRIRKHPHEANFLVAMTIHDLYSNESSNDTSNGGDDYDYRIMSNWNKVANWFRLCGVTLPTNAFAADLNATAIKLDRQFSARPRPKGFGNFHSDIDALNYRAVAMKWRNKMEMMEKSKFDERLFVPKEMYKRKVELSVSLLWKWEQMIMVGSYFEQVTLAQLLNPFCGLSHHITTLKWFDTIPFRRNYFLCSLTHVAATHSPTTQARSLASYLSSICPKDNFTLQLELINQDECSNNTAQKRYKKILFRDDDDIEMIVPEEMQHFVAKLMANSSNIIPFKTSHQEHNVSSLSFNDAIDWFRSDFYMYLAGKEFSPDSIASQKIVYYLILLAQFGHIKFQMDSFIHWYMPFVVLLGFGLLAAILLVVSLCISRPSIRQDKTHVAKTSSKKDNPAAI